MGTQMHTAGHVSHLPPEGASLLQRKGLWGGHRAAAPSQAALTTFSPLPTGLRPRSRDK